MSITTRAICTTCRASSADPALPMLCERDDCPGEAERRAAEQLRSEERAYERGEHESREEARQERLQRMREWDIAMGNWMPALACAFLLAAALPVHAENCVSLMLKTAKYSVTKTQRVATAWRTELVVNPTTGMHEPVQVPTAWTNETVSMGTFYGIAEVIAALKNDAAPGIAYKISQPATIYAGAVPNVAPGPNTQGWRGICLDTIDDRLLINRPVR